MRAWKIIGIILVINALLFSFICAPLFILTIIEPDSEWLTVYETDENGNALIDENGQHIIYQLSFLDSTKAIMLVVCLFLIPGLIMIISATNGLNRKRKELEQEKLVCELMSENATLIKKYNNLCTEFNSLQNNYKTVYNTNETLVKNIDAQNEDYKIKYDNLRKALVDQANKYERNEKLLNERIEEQARSIAYYRQKEAELEAELARINELYIKARDKNERIVSNQTRVETLSALNAINTSDKDYGKLISDKLRSQNGTFPGIYKIVHIATGKVYIGQTIRPIIDRVLEHITISANAMSAKLFESGKLKNEEDFSIDEAIQFYGADAFEYLVEKALLDPTVEDLNMYEKKFIHQYKSNINGFNKTAGNNSLLEAYV